MRIIAIEKMVLHTSTGNYPAERLLGNDLEVSIKLGVQAAPGSNHDELAYTIDYEAVYDLVSAIFQEPMNLLETAVSRIIVSISVAYPDVVKMKVRVAKLNPPLSGKVNKVWVEEAWDRNSGEQR